MSLDKFLGTIDGIAFSCIMFLVWLLKYREQYYCSLRMSALVLRHGSKIGPRTYLRNRARAVCCFSVFMAGAGVNFIYELIFGDFERFFIVLENFHLVVFIIHAYSTHE